MTWRTKHRLKYRADTRVGPYNSHGFVMGGLLSSRQSLATAVISSERSDEKSFLITRKDFSLRSK